MTSQCFHCGEVFELLVEHFCKSVLKEDATKLECTKELIRKGIEPKHNVLAYLKEKGYERLLK